MSDLIPWVKCQLFGHKDKPDRAVDWEPDGYTRHHKDGTTEPIPSCYIVEKCQRCGGERRVYAPADTAEMFGIPIEWDQPDE